MIRTKTTPYHKGSKVEILAVLPPFNDYERVRIRFSDNGAQTWINIIYLEEDQSGEIRKAIEALPQ